MKWYHYVAAFFAGIILCDGIPHFINGVAGDAFPTPFANPPGRGLSPSYINVIWGLLLFLVGYLLYRVSGLSYANKIGIAIFGAGVSLMAIALSIFYAGRMHY